MKRRVSNGDLGQYILPEPATTFEQKMACDLWDTRVMLGKAMDLLRAVATNLEPADDLATLNDIEALQEEYKS